MPEMNKTAPVTSAANRKIPSHSQDSPSKKNASNSSAKSDGKSEASGGGNGTATAAHGTSSTGGMSATNATSESREKSTGKGHNNAGEMNYVPGAGAFEASTTVSSEQYSTNFPPVMSKIFSPGDHSNTDLTSSMLASPHHHHEDLSAQHYHNQQLQTQQYQSYAGQAAAASAAQSADFSSYGPMYSNYMKSCRTGPYQRPNPASNNPASPNVPGLPSPAAGMYYPGFSNAAAAAAAAAAGLYSRPHNMYDYTAGGTMHHHAPEVPR